MTRVPETIEGVKTLLTARKWDKAAIVWSFVQGEEGRGRPKKGGEKPKYNISQFADLGIAGLSDRKTVRLYWQRWQDAIDSGDAQPVAPGDEIVEPDLDWPPTGHSHGIAEGMREDATDEDRIKAAEKLIERLPEGAGAKIALDVLRALGGQRIDEGTRYVSIAKREAQEKKPLIPVLSMGTICADMKGQTKELARLMQNNPLDAEGKQLILVEVQEVRNGLDFIQSLLESPHSDWDAGLAELTDDDEN